MPSGYSGTPTARKLGIAAGTGVVVLGAPGDYTALVDGLPDGALWVSWPKKAGTRPYNF